ncbi:hypothetical protein EYC80_001729 [Monilinia laxa]|uniref:Uncharacterized protein n=1 Tax=Monilinia laxa TaxID=61186 RepID=A0A5N6K5U9_MONLA|nr:hypothetical protein EYC80_001729 [Monilinia laxa]
MSPALYYVASPLLFDSLLYVTLMLNLPEPRDSKLWVGNPPDVVVVDNSFTLPPLPEQTLYISSQFAYISIF